MPNPIFAEKRTRSQVTLPDELLFQLSQGSPLKDARTALKNTSHRPGTPAATHDEIVEETDDELLLSPGKNEQSTRTAKRSVSPLPGDEYAFRSDSPSERRRLKRLRRDGDGDTALDGKNVLNSKAPRAIHTRSLSQPEAGKKASHIYSRTTPGSGTLGPQAHPHANASPAKGRAQSVPLFPTSSSSGVIHIDLRNPPPSPRRPRSQSPSKERVLRLVVGPPVAVKLDTIPDEMGPAMNLDETQTEPSNTPVSFLSDTSNLPTSQDPSSDKLEEPTKVIMEPPIPSIYEPPATPLSKDVAMTPLSLSPLTPLPETPRPSKLIELDRTIKSGWETSAEHEISDVVQAPIKPLLSLGAVRKSRLPRPSSTVNLAATSVGHPPALAAPLTKSAIFGSTKSSTGPPKPIDAFTVLMAGARQKNERVNGKGKAAIIGGLSSVITTKSFGGSSKVTSKVTGNTRERTELPQKVSLKAKMKPKTKLKPKPLPLPLSTSPNSELEDRHPYSPSPGPSPPPTSDPYRPSTPIVVDVSMEIIEPKVDYIEGLSTEAVHNTAADVSMDGIESLMRVEVNSSIAPNTTPMTEVVPDATETPNTPDVSPMELQEIGKTPLISVVESIDVPMGPPISSADQPQRLEYISGPETVHSAVIDTPIDPSMLYSSAADAKLNGIVTSRPPTKFSVSKRVPSITPIARVTRSASLKQNSKSAGAPTGIPRTFKKQTLASRKSIPSIGPTQSGSSSKTTDGAQQHGGASLHTHPDLSTDAVAFLPPGSPMKLSSPVKSALASGSSYTQPMRPTAAKEGLSNSPVKAKSAKSTPSPNKLTRSVSMYSRPKAGLSRTFTGLSSLSGSSLSTLSSALEKLQQPPPGRPNTSMGFNRDGPDSSFELKTTSKDDTSIGASSSPQPVSRGGPLVQQTLIHNPRPSVTSNHTMGTGSMIRGTGAINPPRTGLRVFGLGRGRPFADVARARTMQKASRKTSLPSVMASPVKGRSDGDAMEISDTEDTRQEAEAFNADPFAEQEMTKSRERKGKERATDSWAANASRRVSLASQALSQSLNGVPTKAPITQGLMGPPETPKGRNGTRSASSTYPSSVGETSDQGSPSTRSSLRIAANKPKTKIPLTAASATSSVPDALKILKDCVIFVDVRTDDGDEAGSLFVEMLEGVGARILTRVGQTCTHIVYKNGLVGTLNRYRLLREPKPFLVGIAWVVECVEQRKRVDEEKFVVDLEGENATGTNKRRRSMLPKLISRQFEEKDSSNVEGDVSMDGSTSSMTADDDLTPLEKARRRKLPTTQ